MTPTGLLSRSRSALRYSNYYRCCSMSVLRTTTRHYYAHSPAAAAALSRTMVPARDTASTSPLPGSSPSSPSPAPTTAATATISPGTGPGTGAGTGTGTRVQVEETKAVEEPLVGNSGIPISSATTTTLGNSTVPGPGTLPALPAPTPSGDGTPAPGTTVVEVNGAAVMLDNLGPMVVGRDGMLSRIANWGEMTDLERKNTLRVLGKRNQLRLANLRGEKQE